MVVVVVQVVVAVLVIVIESRLWWRSLSLSLTLVVVVVVRCDARGCMSMGEQVLASVYAPCVTCCRCCGLICGTRITLCMQAVVGDIREGWLKGRLVVWVSIVVCSCGSTVCVHAVVVVNARGWKGGRQAYSMDRHACRACVGCQHERGGGLQVSWQWPSLL